MDGDDRGYAIWLIVAVAIVLLGVIARGDLRWRSALGMAAAWAGIFALAWVLASAFLGGRALG